MSLADSDILINYLNRRGPGLEIIERELQARRLWTTTISLFEVLAGSLSPRRHAAAIALFAEVPAIPFTRDCAERAAEIDQLLRSQGLRIPTADTLIAGVALARGLPLITRNRRHFERIPGLELVALE